MFDWFNQIFSPVLHIVGTGQPPVNCWDEAKYRNEVGDEAKYRTLVVKPFSVIYNTMDYAGTQIRAHVNLPEIVLLDI